MKLGIQQDNSTIAFLNLMSIDASNVENFIMMATGLISSPVKSILIVTILVKRVNYMILSGVVFFFIILLPLQFLLSRLTGILKYDLSR
jgi:hypothetical protein